MKNKYSVKGINRNTAIFVVEDDHAILYAGKSFSFASGKIRGSNRVSVWQSNQWLGDVDSNGEWVFKTKHCPAI